MRLLRLVCVCLALSACSSSSSSNNKSNAPPIIDDLSIPTTATATGGVYTVKGTITVHDTDDAVSKMHIHIAGANDLPDKEFPGGFTQGTAEVILEVAAHAGTTLNYEVTVIDASGTSSAPVQGSVELK